jgi:hypothetical protein
MSKSNVPPQSTASELPTAHLDPSIEPLMAKVIAVHRAMDDLLALVSAAKEDVLTQFKSATLLVRERAASQLDMSPGQLDRETRKGAIPVIQIDRRPRFCVADLETYINSRRSTSRKRRSDRPKASSQVSPSRKRTQT